MDAAAIVRWTGRGNVANLESSVNEVCRVEGKRVNVSRTSGCLVVGGADPVWIATVCRHLPGVDWVAVGHQAADFGGLVDRASDLGKRYLSKGATFAVTAESKSQKVMDSDLGGAVYSAMLGTVRGARVDEASPRVRFHAILGDAGGAVGVRLRDGPGGTPTGRRQVDCLVSGGMHSAVVTWHALLCGFRVRMAHLKTGDDGLLAVGSLYAELSHRVDPRALSLSVTDGGRLETLIVGLGKRPLSGLHAECGDMPGGMHGRLDAPLSFMTEEEFDESFRELGVRESRSRYRWGALVKGTGKTTTFGGVRADVHRVLDGLGRRP